MNRLFQVFAYVFAITIGAYLLILTKDGQIIKICIACNSLLLNLFAGVSILTGGIGLFGMISSRRAITKR
jgi:hypothetical protein